MARFVLGFGNRSFFPPKYMHEARKELPAVLKDMGHETVMMDEKQTNLGAVATRDEGRKFAEFLEKKAGRYDGIIWTHPNFGDEVGMLPALRAAGKRGDNILLHGYPDDMDKMGPDERRDSFCGLFSTMDVLYQNQIPFVKLMPHVVAPSSPRFKENIEVFDKICTGKGKDPFKLVKPEKTTGGENILDGCTLLALGARTTPFYTTRFNELDAVKNGINVETADLSLVFDRMKKVDAKGDAYRKRETDMRAYTNWDKASSDALDTQIRFSVVVDQYLDEYKPDAIAVRCWTEFQEILRISPCATVSYFNNRGIPTACEVDLGNALAMYVMRLFSKDAVACQDWNNNFFEEDDKFMFMHCGPHDTAWLKPGHYVDTHGILDHSFGSGCGMGCIQGRFVATPTTFASCSTEDGKLKFYVAEGHVTDDGLPEDYFGSAGVAEIPGLQQALLQIGHGGYKHHFSMTKGHVADQVVAALRQHPGFEVTDLRKVQA